MDDFSWLDGVDEQEIRRQKNKARELRKTRWWQQKTASGKCYYCGGLFTFKDLTMDHRIPLARGGKSSKDNLVPCCRECNTKKKSMMPMEWQQYLDEQGRGGTR